jgi:3-deoxy-manno-octulosonate cytidylyltransferase (CMP-KDO synthetase)
MNVLGIIPSRYGSTRFPGKPLADISGRSMISRVYHQARQATSLSRVIVATDDARIFDHIKSFDGEVLMTSPKHPNGTSRCEEVLRMLEVREPDTKYDLVINIQGDEPFIDPEQIDKVAGIFSTPESQIGTLVKRIENQDDLFNPNIVKVVADNQRRALYFSRQTIPVLRDLPKDKWMQNFDFLKHIGIYGFRSDILKNLVNLKEGKLESAEQLEQLRWLEKGYKITIEVTDFESIAIDTPEDLSKLSNID